jgi:hypothetical protein
MGGKVLRRSGAALLAGLFLAAITARGQTLGAIQIAENHSENHTLATNPSALSSQASAGAGLDEDSASLEKTLASEEANYISDSGDAELPSAPLPIVTTPLDQSAPYQPITGQERFSWIVKSPLELQHLAGGVFTAAVGTALDRPREDGPHWGGYGERFGVRLTGIATSSVMEAGIGAVWGEDPRYFRVPELSYRARIWNAMRMAFMARRPDGHFELAYARFIAVPGNNFLTNAWRPDSEANVHDAVLRTLEGFAGHMVSNAWAEFWPETKAYLFHRKDRQP